jgi:NADPH2:quinone reductase
VKDGTNIMLAMRAEGFSGFKDLKLVDIPKPAVSDGRVLVRITAAGVTPLEHTILSGDTQEPKHCWSWEEREEA